MSPGEIVMERVRAGRYRAAGRDGEDFGQVHEVNGGWWSLWLASRQEHATYPNLEGVRVAIAARRTRELAGVR